MATNALNTLKSQLSGLDAYQPEDEATLRQRAENIYKPQYEQDLMSLKDSLNSQLATQARSALSNGMQRSSYNQAAQASIRGAGLRSEAQLGATYEGNVGAALANMLDKEKDRKDAADQYRNNLLLQIYNLEQAEKKSKGNGDGDNNGKDKTPVPYNPNAQNDFLKQLNSLGKIPTLKQYTSWGADHFANASWTQKANLLSAVNKNQVKVDTTKPVTPTSPSTLLNLTNPQTKLKNALTTATKK